MPILVIVPSDELRHQLRDRFAVAGGSLRARTYANGLVLAEQNWISDAVLWSPPGADREVIDTIVRLRKFNRDIRIVVATPRFNRAGTSVFVDHLQVDAYFLDGAVDDIVEAVLGVPVIVEGKESPPTTLTGGSSAASH